jgi:hypothetical protein
MILEAWRQTIGFVVEAPWKLAVERQMGLRVAGEVRFELKERYEAEMAMVG